jgi:hypothetical protein
MMPFSGWGFLRAAVVFGFGEVFAFATPPFAAVLRGDLAAEVFVVAPVLPEDAGRFGFEVLEPAGALDLAVAAREAVDRDLLLRAVPLVFRADDAPEARPPTDLLLFFVAGLFFAEALAPVLFLAGALLRLLLAAFFDEDEADLLRDELEPVFFEAVDLELVLFFELPAEPFFDVLAERDFDPELFFVLADVLDEPELFFEPPALLEPAEREPLDFLVVAIRIIPPFKIWCVSHKHKSAKVVPIDKMY